MSEKLTTKDALRQAIVDLSEGVLLPEEAESVARGLISRGFVTDEDDLRAKHGVSVQPAPQSTTEPSAHDLMLSRLIGPRPSPTLGKLALSPLDATHRSYMELCEKLDKDPYSTMLARKNFGLEKYGTILQPSNGRNHLEDALDELADALVYLICDEYNTKVNND
ncbi:hypothetical protein TIN4_107 [Tsukamurella phage TIN4]|uniref:Uncharacterized protein n=2 Tax=Tinduovirus TIN3 TaxID=1982571 RepID=A0A0K0N683_9CAUD|nr:hypothetical protein AVT54_gp018 [Tsukamurella phage TIN3]YP_009604237.1 hypothetical protein FDH87_gp018 [Tsukamurella phage TIN4]AKJ71904.1 hypothetical protein TIN3_107 [Tsukamurella phage TIN3]AKJ72013.1 hypothetical protein TIN4_107 [Tsukamurella phage TIN4]